MNDPLNTRVARVIADSAAAVVTAMGMLSENLSRIQAGHALAYPEESFDRVLSACRLTELDLDERLKADSPAAPAQPDDALLLAREQVADLRSYALDVVAVAARGVFSAELKHVVAELHETVKFIDGGKSRSRAEQSETCRLHGENSNHADGGT